MKSLCVAGRRPGRAPHELIGKVLAAAGAVVAVATFLAITAYASGVLAQEIPREHCRTYAHAVEQYAEIRDAGADQEKLVAYVRRMNAEFGPKAMDFFAAEVRRVYAEGRTPSEEFTATLMRCLRASRSAATPKTEAL